MPTLRTNDALSYLLTDHLGSTSVSYNTSTGAVSAQRYTLYGAPRGPASTFSTDYRFTGQRSEEAGLGSLYDYNARHYSPALGRFLSPDSIVPSPGNPSHGDFLRSQSLNRYAYVLNNPLRYTDPTGHCAEEDKKCIGRLRAIQAEFGVEIDDSAQLFTLEALNAIAAGMSALRELLGDANFAKVAAGTKFIVYHGPKGKGYNGVAHDGNGTILVGDKVLGNQEYLTRYTPHELAHVWDWKCNDCMSRGMQLVTGSRDETTRGFLFTKKTTYVPEGKPPTKYARNNRLEDWAESLTAVVDPSYASGWQDARQSYVGWALTVGVPSSDAALRRWAR